jgi:hypothetical protein
MFILFSSLIAQTFHIVRRAESIRIRRDAIPDPDRATDAARHARSQTRAAVVGQTLFFSGKAA